MTLNLRRSKIYLAVVADRLFPKSALKFYRASSLIIGVIALAGWVLSQILSRSFYLDQESFRGIFYIFLSLGISVSLFEIYIYYYLRYPKLKESDNLADWLSFGSARALVGAQAVSETVGEKEVGPLSVLVAILKDRSTDEVLVRVPHLSQILAEFQQQSSNFGKRAFRPHSTMGNYSQETRELINGAYEFMKERDGEKISPLDIMVSMFDFEERFKRVILSSDLDKQDLKELSYWYEHIWSYRQKVKRFWSLDNLYRKPPVGKDWIFGFLPRLNSFGQNLTLEFRYSGLPFRLTSRKKEMERMEEILVRSGENNVMLVGLEGVGKDRVIEDFAEMLAHGRALPALNYKNMFWLDMAKIISSSKSVIEVQNILISALNESIQAGNVILIISDLHNYVGEVEGLGRLDLAEVILPYLRSSRVQLIATTDLVNYHRLIEARSDLASLFERIDINEPDKIQTLRVLEERVPSIEHRSGVLITYSAMKSVVDNADKFITSAPFPEKALDLLSEVVSHVVSTGSSKLITKEKVEEVVTRKTGVPLGPVAGDEKDKLSNFEKLMRKELVGQERAIEVVSATLRRLRAGLGGRGRPAGVFLFVGPTGVGKTHTAKILARAYFGAEDKMIRFDMSEFQNTDALNRFLGNPETNEPGQFVTAVRDNPFSLILLDEIEKANKNLLNIFLQVFDEGHLTDVFGHKVSFEQSIIIATSNAAAASIRDMVLHNVDPAEARDSVVDIIIKEGYFSPEFLNRFDEVVIFHPLSEEQVKEVATILIEQLKKRMADKGYIYEPTDEVTEYVAREGFDPQFGARPMQRVIKDKIENLIAKKILDGDVQKGVSFSISNKDIG